MPIRMAIRLTGTGLARITTVTGRSLMFVSNARSGTGFRMQGWPYLSSQMIARMMTRQASATGRTKPLERSLVRRKPGVSRVRNGWMLEDVARAGKVDEIRGHEGDAAR